ncbi:MAG TPA: helix-hairpin-helix domain-containing protein [Vicinamibacterales bacterium]|nr:helix-hairpin-helix domain-containing protein [Vicinamibacterales bacterium]
MQRSYLTGLVVLMVLVLAAGVGRAQDQQTQAKPKPTPTTRLTVSTPVNLNTATTVELESLPGIGPATAERILEYRQKNGAFKKIEDLMNVRGIGEKTFLKLKPLITVTPPKLGE